MNEVNPAAGGLNTCLTAGYVVINVYQISVINQAYLILSR